MVFAKSKMEGDMSLQFQGSARATIGVEIELQIIDPHTMDLAPRAQEVLALCERRGISHVKAEIHQSMLEVDTEVATSVKECRQCLQNTLAALQSVVAELGLVISTSGTHPFQNWAERQIFPSPRYDGLHKKFRWLVKRMNVYGLHVHVGTTDAEKALALTRSMIRFLPLLLALSANSPFWNGEETGMQACRPNIIESFPTGGLPPYLESWSDFESYYETLFRARAIASAKDLYWYIRPNLSFGTVEFRICDAMSSMNEIMAVVALIQNLVQYVEDDLDCFPWEIKQHWIAPENNLIAARDGLQGIIVTDLKGTRKKIADEIYRLVEAVTPIAKNLDNYEELQYIKQILTKGNGAVQQRKIFAETQSLYKLVEIGSEDFLSNMLNGDFQRL